MCERIIALADDGADPHGGAGWRFERANQAGEMLRSDASICPKRQGRLRKDR